MRDAVRATGVSHAFLHSWKCHPNLTFSCTTLGLNKKAYENDETARDFSSKVDHMLRNHSGIGVKKLKIHMFNYCNAKDSCYLNSWLQIAVKPGIEELAVTLPFEFSLLSKRSTLPMETEYNFPCSLLSNGSGDSIRYLDLAGCALRPTAELAWLKSLTKVQLYAVSFTGDELGCLLCNSFALKRLEIRYCDGVVCLKIPCMLQRLRYLEVIGCDRLQVIDSKAQNISSFCFEGDHRVQLSLGETLQMKKIYMIFSGAVRRVCVELPSSMPNLKIAAIHSGGEMDTPMLHSKFLHLKKLSITLTAGTFSPAYDYFSLVSFLDACPSLETLILDVSQTEMKHISISTDPLDPRDLRKMQGQEHHKLKRVKILGFTSARSLIELACHVVESTTPLKRRTLEAHQSCVRCSVPIHKTSKCSPLPDVILMEAR